MTGRIGLSAKTASRAIVLFVSLLFLTLSCSGKPEVLREKSSSVNKRQMPLWQVLRHRPASPRMLWDKKDVPNDFVYEDRWYKYVVEFERPPHEWQVNKIIASCPIYQALYTVTDRESGEVVRHETIGQDSCKSCHPF